MFLKYFFNKFVSKPKQESIIIPALTQELHSKNIDDLTQELHSLNIDYELLNEEIDKIIIRQRNLDKKTHAKLIDAVLEVFKTNEGELNATEVFAKIKTKRLKNRKTKFSSVKATIYYLLRRKKIVNGTKRGTFKFTP